MTGTWRYSLALQEADVGRLEQHAVECVRRFYEEPTGSRGRDDEYGYALCCFREFQRRELTARWHEIVAQVKAETNQV